MRRSTITRICVAAGLGLAGTSLIAGPASADPKVELVPLDCGDQAFAVAVNGNGEFTPGHLTNGTSVLVPVSFGEFHGVVTDEAGAVVQEFTDPATSKGKSAKNKTLVNCTFSFSETGEDPEIGPGTFTFTGSGSVQGFLTPRR